MSWLLAFHIIFVITWFAGLFYLPRLFVYHAAATDQVSLQRFNTMEHKLCYYIMTPSGILATLFGLSIFSLQIPYYMQAGWMHAKLLFVLLLWIYHFFCIKYLRDFKLQRNNKTEKFFRLFNEVPSVILVVVVILAVVKPF